MTRARRPLATGTYGALRARHRVDHAAPATLTA
jgi:hypothetical protein